MIKGIDHIDISVNDVEEAIKIFQKMGFELLWRTTHIGGAVELKLPGANQPIFELHKLLDHHPKGNPGIPGVIHIAFLVDSAQKTLDELKAKGISARRDTPSFQPESGRTMVDVDNEDLGLWLQFVEEGRKPFTTL